MSDKDILYSMINREVDNLIGLIIPSMRMFAPYVSRYITHYIDPYVDIFLMGTDSLNTEAAKGYINQEVNEKLENFVRQFESEKHKNANSIDPELKLTGDL